MRQYYSQNGEDFLLWSLFKNRKAPGFFVEVGSLDGIRFSNTYSFECENWTGLCVEPHPDYYPILKKNRPHSVCIQAAAGKQEGEIEFFAEPRGDFSTTVQENIQNEIVAKKMAGYTKITVTILTLDSILQNANIVLPLDIISIDVEGAELNVLEGFNLAFYKPRILVIEANDDVTDKQLDDYMRSNGYYKAGRMGRTNNFYCRSLFDTLKIAFTTIQCTLNTPPHPLDPRVGVDDEWKTQQIYRPNLAWQSWQNLLKRIVKRLTKLKKS